MDSEPGLRSRLSGPPPITEELRAQARARPGGWVYVLDPAVDPAGEVPGWAVRGGFEVGADGELTGEYTANPNYRPAPANDLEAALRRGATGTGTDDALLDAVLAGDLFLFARSPGDTDLFVRDDTLQAFTSEALLPRGWEHWQRRAGRRLVPVLAGRSLQLNPGRPVGVTIPGDDLVARAQRKR